ncbi:MAG: PSD1 and planctomycete cytochrome C domain-containing protein [Planctomycetales bacterium]
MVRRAIVPLIILAVLISPVAFGWCAEENRPVGEVTQHDVLPILWLRCVVCHGARVTEGGLDLRRRESLLQGGKSGPAIVPGNPDASLLLQRIRAEEMPPRRRVVEVSIKPIEPVEIDILTRWIATGAPESPLGPDVATTDADPLVTDADRQFWAFQTPRRSEPPLVVAVHQVRNLIDAFLLARLETQGLTLAPAADRQVLLRRLFFDLIGLPPTPAQVEEFLADTDPAAYERLVERLLASPHYGERWGRYWLDLAGYSDSNGVQHSDLVRDEAWRYRDYVIRSFQTDKPYDRFLHEQIAGDELEDYQQPGELTQERYDNLVATGFLRMTPDGTSANITNFVPDRLEIIADELHVLTSAVLGLTVKCARCHTHKTDPIPQRDYYRLAAVFKGAYDEHDWLKVTRKEDARGPWGERLLDRSLPAERQAWETAEKAIQEEIQRLTATLQQGTTERISFHLEMRLAKLPEALRDDLRQVISTPDSQRNEIQKYLASKFEAGLTITQEELKTLEPDFKRLADETSQGIKTLEGRKQPKPAIHALWDRGEPSPTYILRRGDYTKPEREVGPGVLSALTDGRTPFPVEPPLPGARSTGRRLAFARWLTSSDHPLTARVMVNRLWRHHFGAGLVRTLDNFGVTGELPTHPELLDTLAREFIDTGWSIKQLHRLMVHSAAYRQTSRSNLAQMRIDPDNKLLSRMPLRRLEAEALRDSLLAVAGQLDTTPFGKPDPVEVHPQSGLVSTSGVGGSMRRTIYLLQRRTQTLTLLEDFDLPQMTPNCVDRPLSTVAPQALHLMNNRAVHESARLFAQRVRDTAGEDPLHRIEAAWNIALARAPSDDERELAAAALQDLTREWIASRPATEDAAGAGAAQHAADEALVNLCHALLNSAEFLTID